MEKLTTFIMMGLRGLVILSRLAFTVFVARYIDLTTLGQFALVDAAATILPIILSLGLINTITRDAVSQSPIDITKHLKIYWLLVTVLYGALIIPCLLAQTAALVPFNLVLCLAIVYLEHLNQDARGVLLRRKQFSLFSVVLFLRAAWVWPYMALAFAYPELRTLDAILTTWALMLIIPLGLFFTYARTWPWLTRLQLSGLPGWLRQRLIPSLLLNVAETATIVSLYVDRYAVSYFLGFEMTGIYVVFWQTANAVYNLINIAIGQVYRTLLISAFDEKDAPRHRQLLIDLLRTTIGAFLGLSLAVAAALYLALPFLDKPQAVGYFPILLPLLGASLSRLLADAFGHDLFSRRMDADYTKTTLFMLWITLLATAPFTFTFGIYGAAIALFLATLFVSFLRWRASPTLTFRY